MTLILSCLTPDFVYQVSDRRLTSLAEPWALIDDEAKKAVFVDGRIAFSYAGLAQIGTSADDERTDQWLARIVGTGAVHDLAAVAERIRSQATEAFSKIDCPRARKRHAFQGAGWLCLQGEDVFTPGVITVHNAYDAATGNWRPEADDEFSVSTMFPTRFPAGCVLTSIGKTLHGDEKSAIARLLRKCVKHRNSTPRRVATGLATGVRWLSGRYEPDSPIGKSLMILAVPRTAVERMDASGESFLLSGGPATDSATFAYLSATGQTTYFGPHAVYSGTTLTNLSLTPISKSDA